MITQYTRISEINWGLLWLQLESSTCSRQRNLDIQCVKIVLWHVLEKTKNTFTNNFMTRVSIMLNLQQRQTCDAVSGFRISEEISYLFLYFQIFIPFSGSTLSRAFCVCCRTHQGLSETCWPHSALCQAALPDTDPLAAQTNLSMQQCKRFEIKGKERIIWVFQEVKMTLFLPFTKACWW